MTRSLKFVSGLVEQPINKSTVWFFWSRYAASFALFAVARPDDTRLAYEILLTGFYSTIALCGVVGYHHFMDFEKRGVLFINKDAVKMEFQNDGLPIPITPILSAISLADSWFRNPKITKAIFEIVFRYSLAGGCFSLILIGIGVISGLLPANMLQRVANVQDWIFLLLVPHLIGSYLTTYYVLSKPFNGVKLAVVERHKLDGYARPPIAIE